MLTDSNVVCVFFVLFCHFVVMYELRQAKARTAAAVYRRCCSQSWCIRTLNLFGHGIVHAAAITFRAGLVIFFGFAFEIYARSNRAKTFKKWILKLSRHNKKKKKKPARGKILHVLHKYGLKIQIEVREFERSIAATPFALATTCFM